MHVHVTQSDGEAKFWLEPAVEVALNQGRSPRQISDAFVLVQSHREEIIAAKAPGLKTRRASAPKKSPAPTRCFQSDLTGRLAW